jgi:hypothetical protein
MSAGSPPIEARQDRQGRLLIEFDPSSLNIIDQDRRRQNETYLPAEICRVKVMNRRSRLNKAAFYLGINLPMS